MCWCSSGDISPIFGDPLARSVTWYKILFASTILTQVCHYSERRHFSGTSEEKVPEYECASGSYSLAGYSLAPIFLVLLSLLFPSINEICLSKVLYIDMSLIRLRNWDQPFENCHWCWKASNSWSVVISSVSFLVVFIRIFCSWDMLLDSACPTCLCVMQRPQNGSSIDVFNMATSVLYCPGRSVMKISMTECSVCMTCGQANGLRGSRELVLFQHGWGPRTKTSRDQLRLNPADSLSWEVDSCLKMAKPTQAQIVLVS